MVTTILLRAVTKRAQWEHNNAFALIRKSRSRRAPCIQGTSQQRNCSSSFFAQDIFIPRVRLAPTPTRPTDTRRPAAPKEKKYSNDGKGYRSYGIRWMSSKAHEEHGVDEERKDGPASPLPLKDQGKDGHEDVQDIEQDRNRVHMDFFGEPVTFLAESEGSTLTPTSSVDSALAALDGMMLGTVSKGQSCIGGGEEKGLGVQAANSHAITWAEVIRHASVWRERTPMLSYVAVVPMLVQTGLPYVKYVDSLLSTVVEEALPKSVSINLYELAKDAAAQKDNEILNVRERTHLRALDCMLKNDNRRAMFILEQHLQQCPGDVFALSVVMDICHTLGDKAATFRIAASLAAYWNERRGSFLRPGLPGYDMTASLVALGFAVGGRYEDAEQLCIIAMGRKTGNISGGLSTWALAHVYDAQGRTAEGISACSNPDGIVKFEKCGQMFFDCILGGYGVRFALDREQRGRGRQSPGLRLYDTNYERLFDYTGFTHGILVETPQRKAPVGWTLSGFSTPQSSGGQSQNSFMQKLFGVTAKKTKTDLDAIAHSENEGAELILDGKEKVPMPRKDDDWVPVIEDVLTWLPPTPQVLSDATLLLLRLTLNGTIASSNYRWDHIRNGWSAMFELQQRHGMDSDISSTFKFYPLAGITAALVTTPERAGITEGTVGRLAKGLHKMGKLIKLGSISLSPDDYEQDDEERNEINVQSSYITSQIFREIVADTQPNFWLPALEEEKSKEWRQVLHLLSSGIDGVYSPMSAEEGTELNVDLAEFTEPFESSWEFDARPILEHAVVYAACKCGDTASLSVARSICSRGVTLRPNSPEEWWRYSIVLGLLGDEVASEDARNASIALGTGQGATRSE